MKTAGPMKAIVIVSMVIGLFSGIFAPFVGELHVYRVTSGYSGQHYWLTFSSAPTEEALLDAVIYREPLIPDRYETKQAWRRAQKDGTRLYIKRDADSSIVIAPYDETKDPDTVFANGGRVKGVWLTQPATRTRFPVALVGLAYCIGAFLVLSVAALCAFVVVRWLWYFLLRRISELSRAVRHDPSA
jgi:hypothetical protein